MMRSASTFLYLLLAGVSGVTLLTENLSHATLGEPASSVDQDLRSMPAVRKSTQTHSEYTVHEMLSGGTTIREYVSPSNIVFGIAWDGIAHPDLPALLGSYTEDYREGMKQSPRTPGKRSHSIKSRRVVVEKWGHMRSLHGRAYSPSLIPSGVNPDEIK